MIFLLDTNALSDLMRKPAKVEAPLTSLAANDSVIMFPIVRGEIRDGTLSTTYKASVRAVRIMAFHIPIDFELAQTSKIGSS